MNELKYFSPVGRGLADRLGKALMQTTNPVTIKLRRSTAGAKPRARQIERTEISKTLSERPRRRANQIKIQVEFKLAASEAQSVSVAGSFNNWDVKRTPLRKEVNCWTTVITLPRGNYEYRFVVDGKWMDDPGAKESIQNPFGGRNAVLII